MQPVYQGRRMEEQERATADEHSEQASSHGNGTPNGQSAEEAEDRALMEQFLLNPAHDYRNLQYGDTVDGTIMRIDKAAMIRVLHKEPTFADLFMSHLLSRNIQIEEALVDQLFNSSEKRLARILLLLAHFGKDTQVVEPTIPKIRQETLAEMVGTTRSRVSFFLNKFRKLGFIDYNSGLRIRSSLLNIVLLD